MEFDYDTLRKYLSDELFNTYKSQLKVLSAKKQRNIMHDFEKHNIDITAFNKTNCSSIHIYSQLRLNS